MQMMVWTEFYSALPCLRNVKTVFVVGTINYFAKIIHIRALSYLVLASLHESL